MQTAKHNGVPGCPRVEVLSIDYDKAAVRSDEAEPGFALDIVPVSELSSFEEGRAAEPEVGDAATEVDAKMRGRLDDLHTLQRLANPGVDLDEWSNDELLALDIGYGEPGPLSREYVEEAAQERLDEYPLCVATRTVFEIVLGTGGPDDRLIVECDVSTDPERELQPQYRVRRILYRYSWTGSAERELYGEDRETAEGFARRVVAELVE
jgi:hypothetical protein